MLDSGRLIEADRHQDRQGAVSVRVPDGQRRDRIVQTEGELAAGPERLQEERAVHPDYVRPAMFGSPSFADAAIRQDTFPQAGASSLDEDFCRRAPCRLGVYISKIRFASHSGWLMKGEWLEFKLKAWVHRLAIRS